MRVKFLSNLGISDATAIKNACGAELNWRECVVGAEVDVPDQAVELLQGKYKALIEEVKGVAAPAAIKAVPPAHGTVEKATEDLKAYKDRQTGK